MEPLIGSRCSEKGLVLLLRKLMVLEMLLSVEKEKQMSIHLGNQLTMRGSPAKKYNNS